MVQNAQNETGFSNSLKRATVTVGQTPQCCINYNVHEHYDFVSAALVDLPTQQNVGQGAQLDQQQGQGDATALAFQCVVLSTSKITITLDSSIFMPYIVQHGFELSCGTFIRQVS